MLDQAQEIALLEQVIQRVVVRLILAVDAAELLALHHHARFENGGNAFFAQSGQVDLFGSKHFPQSRTFVVIRITAEQGGWYPDTRQIVGNIGSASGTYLSVATEIFTRTGASGEMRVASPMI